MNSLPYVYANWPSPLMSLQFNDHDFPPLQWHIFNNVFNFQNNFNRLSEESCSKTKRSKFNSSPYIAIVIVLALKVNENFIVRGCTSPKIILSKFNHVIETFRSVSWILWFQEINSLISKSILDTTCSGIIKKLI